MPGGMTNFDSVAAGHFEGAFGLNLYADLGAPIVATVNRIVTSVNLTNAALTIAAQPDTPRNITIAVTDTTPSITAGTVTVVGLDPMGNAVSEVLDLASALTLTGTKIFASVTSVTVAGATVLGGAGDELIVVGVGTIIGLPNPIVAATAIKHVYLGGTRVASPVVTAGPQTSGVDVSAATYNGVKRLSVAYNAGQ